MVIESKRTIPVDLSDTVQSKQYLTTHTIDNGLFLLQHLFTFPP